MNVVPVLVSSCSDECFYGPERGGEGNKATVTLEITSHHDDFTAFTQDKLSSRTSYNWVWWSLVS